MRTLKSFETIADRIAPAIALILTALVASASLLAAG
jgi:hypothetical protein